MIRVRLVKVQSLATRIVPGVLSLHAPAAGSPAPAEHEEVVGTLVQHVRDLPDGRAEYHFTDNLLDAFTWDRPIALLLDDLDALGQEQVRLTADVRQVEVTPEDVPCRVHTGSAIYRVEVLPALQRSDCSPVAFMGPEGSGIVPVKRHRE
jgi:hypothetical protein